MSAYSRIAKSFPNLIEISGKNIDDAGLRALGLRLNGAFLTSVSFSRIDRDNDVSLDMAIETLCKTSPNLIKLSLFDFPRGVSCFTDTAVQSIVRYCPHIEELSLNNWPNITDLSMTYLTQLSCLRVIDLSSCKKLTKPALQQLLQANQKLEVLILSARSEEHAANILDDALMRCIGVNCPNLIKLHLRVDTGTNSDVAAATFEAMFQTLSALEDFQISKYDKLNIILPLLSIYCKKLKHIDLCNVACSDDDFLSICQGCPLIESLSLCSPEATIGITDLAILSLATYLPMLKLLNLSCLNNITDNSLCVLFTQCIHLTSVTLRSLLHITDKSILTLLRHCPQLRSLVLRSNPCLTDYCIQAIPTYCLYIECLDLSSVVTLSHETIVQISKYCKYIHSLWIDSCHQLNNNTILIILNNCKLICWLAIYSTNIRINDTFITQCNQSFVAKRCYKSIRLQYAEGNVCGY